MQIITVVIGTHEDGVGDITALDPYRFVVYYHYGSGATQAETTRRFSQYNITGVNRSDDGSVQ